MEKKKRIFTIISILVSILIVSTGCTSKDEQAANTVENYLTYMVEQDATKLGNITCAEWEESAIMEMDSFQAVKPSLEGMNCGVDRIEGDIYYVKCEGKIVTTYNDEQRDFDLSRSTYKVVSSGSEFAVCGYE